MRAAKTSVEQQDAGSPDVPVWLNDPHYFVAGEKVEVFSFGRWYPGLVEEIGRTRVRVHYTTGSGATRLKSFAPIKVRPVRVQS
jgi:hypothetical protein